MLGLTIIDYCQEVYRWCLTNLKSIILLAIIILTFFKVDGPHNPYKQESIDFTWFTIYWVGLGVASSIGLGTGLHTFVLYLGPHIATVVLAANECNAVPVMLPSRWKFDHF